MNQCFLRDDVKNGVTNTFLPRRIGKLNKKPRRRLVASERTE